MLKDQIKAKIEDVEKVRLHAQQQLIACDGALQILNELLNDEEKENNDENA